MTLQEVISLMYKLGMIEETKEIKSISDITELTQDLFTNNDERTIQIFLISLLGEMFVNENRAN